MEKKIFNESLGKKIVGLLLKNPMSESDLARKIYRNRNARSGIHKWIGKLKKENLIEEKRTNSKSIFYKVKMKALGDFKESEIKFIELVIKRFWNPLNKEPFESLTNLLVLMAVINKLSKIKGDLNGYNPKKDLTFYKSNKKQFWKDIKFRDNFLDRIKSKGDKSNSSKIRLSRDFIFVGLITPQGLNSKLDLFDKSLNNPLALLLDIL